MNFSLRHMRAFIALASLRSFTRAAEHCCLTQSAFSALISNLENDLGVRLFSRNTRNVELTAEGEAFQRIVEHLLPETERALAEMQDLAEQRTGRVKLAAIPSIASGILPHMIAAFSASFPGIAIHVDDAASTVCVDRVRNRQVDVALCAAASPSSDLKIDVLARDTFYFICLADHVLARRRQLSMDDVIDLPIIVFEANSSVRQHLDAAVYPKRWHRSYLVNNLSTAAGFVAAGLGVTIVPTLALSQFRHPALRMIPLSLPINERDICLVRRQGITDSLAAQAFVTLLRTSFEHAMHSLVPCGNGP